MTLQELKDQKAVWQRKYESNKSQGLQAGMNLCQRKIDELDKQIAAMDEKKEEKKKETAKPEKKNWNDFYEKIARILEVREGVTTSDAQGMIDAKEDQIKQRFYHEQNFTPLKAYQSYWGKKESKPKKEKPAPAKEEKKDDKHIADCKELLKQAKERISKRKQYQKKVAKNPVTPADTTEKAAEVIENKLEKQEKAVTPVQAKAIGEDVSEIVKAVKNAMKDRKDAEAFIRNLIKELQKMLGGKFAEGGEIYDKIFYAVQTKPRKSWNELDQGVFNGVTWEEAVSEAYKISKEKNAEVRLSTSSGYNNQGHYFSHSGFADSPSMNIKKLK